MVDLLRRLDGGSTMIKFNNNNTPCLIIYHTWKLLVPAQDCKAYAKKKE